MNKFITIFLITLSITSTNWEVCTEDVKEMVDQVFDIVESFENSPLNPDAAVLKALLGGIDKFVNGCLNLPMDLTKYDSCVDQLMPVFPQISKLIADIKSGATGNLVLDITTMALTLVNGITTCAKQTFVMRETRALF